VIESFEKRELGKQKGQGSKQKRNNVQKYEKNKQEKGRKGVLL